MAGRRTAAFASNARSLRSMEEMSANITTTEAAEAAEAAVAARRTAVERVHIERALVIRERQDDHLIVKESCRDVGSSHRCLASSFSTNELGIRCVSARERERPSSFVRECASLNQLRVGNSMLRTGGGDVDRARSVVDGIDVRVAEQEDRVGSAMRHGSKGSLHVGS